MSMCSHLRAAFDAAMASGDIYSAAAIFDLMTGLNCDGIPDDPDPTNQSGGHGGTIPPRPE